MNKKLLAVAVSSALAVPMAAQAVKYKLSGQVNRAVVYLDDGVGSGVQHVDNISSGTRWRMTGSEDIGNGMQAGFNWEWQSSTNPGFSKGPKDAATGQSQDMRKAEVWFSGQWGKLSVGKGDGAGNGATEVDLSDTWNVNYHGRTSFGGGTAWRSSAAGNPTIAGGLTHGSTFSEFDAFSRNDRVRYDTPAIGPVTVSVSSGVNDLYEAAARLNTAVGGGQLSAAVFWGKNNTVDSRWGGSASFLMSQGTNVTFAYATNELKAPGSPEGDVLYFKLGHKWGNNAVSVGYGVAEDVTAGYEDSGWQIGFNHNIPKAGVDVYAGFHMNELDTPAGVGSVEDISAFVFGTKLKFD